MTTHRSIAHRLEAELDAFGLLLGPDEEVAAAADAAHRGRRLLSAALAVCYPGRDLVFEFEGEEVATRLQGALAFGAATAAVFSPGEPAEGVELLCALFTLGIGLVDGLCDNEPEAGKQLLRLVQERSVAEAAEQRRGRGWLRSGVPPALALDPTVVFAADVVEAFFEMLHAVYPGGGWLPLRTTVGARLEAALEAERSSVDWSAQSAPRAQLIEWSRRTSVLPFEVVQILAGGRETTAATLLGEAVWRIDDLVDLDQDARTGALNAILVAGHEDLGPAAVEAAQKLSAGLQLAAGSSMLFLWFVQQYAGIQARS